MLQDDSGRAQTAPSLAVVGSFRLLHEPDRDRALHLHGPVRQDRVFHIRRIRAGRALHQLRVQLLLHGCLGPRRIPAREVRQVLPRRGVQPGAGQHRDAAASLRDGSRHPDGRQHAEELQATGAVAASLSASLLRWPGTSSAKAGTSQYGCLSRWPSLPGSDTWTR